MDWPTASIIIGIALGIIGSFTSIFLRTRKNGRYNEGSIDIKWREDIIKELTEVRANQKSYAEILNRFKDDVKADINQLNNKIDNLSKP